jgi:hypothetical protein
MNSGGGDRLALWKGVSEGGNLNVIGKQGQAA